MPKPAAPEYCLEGDGPFKHVIYNENSFEKPLGLWGDNSLFRLD